MLRILSPLVGDGPTQMTTDEALLQCAPMHDAAVLRTYTWSPATVSLGYFQDFDSVAASLPHNVPVVRRITGGGAIWHEHEITYSLIAHAGRDVPARSSDLYHLIHQAIAHELRKRGASIGHQAETSGDRRYRDEPRCFASPASDDLIHPNGGKVLSSAVRTRGDYVLLHGSLKTASNDWDQEVTASCELPPEEAREPSSPE